jgi:hypothetical protein
MKQPPMASSQRALSANWGSGDENLLTSQQAARVLALSTSWHAKLRLFRNGPLFLKLGRVVRYRREDLASWAEAKLHRSTSDDGSHAQAVPEAGEADRSRCRMASLGSRTLDRKSERDNAS